MLGTGSEIIEKFKRVISGLKTLSLNSEDHFLKVSEKLQNYYSSSRQIFQNASEVTELLSSKEYQSGIDNLNQFSKQFFSTFNTPRLISQPAARFYLI